MAEKKKYNSILVSGRKDQTLTYSKFVKDEESGESVKESLDKKVNVTDELTTQQIKDGAITNEKMAADSVGNTNLQDGSVSNEKLEDGSITNEKLAENSITKDKLKDNTIGVEKLDPELRQTINAATGLPENLVETIQNVDDTLKDHQRQLDDKQQQITANDEDISLLQTRSTQMEETIKDIAATGGASQATAVTYDNEKSKLSAVNIQSAVDEVVDKTAIKDEEGTVVETPFRYIQNEEFIFAKVDAEDKLLFGFQRNGTPVFGKTSAVEDRLQSQVNLLADKITSILGDDDTTSAIDTLKELKDFFANIDNTQTLTSILTNLNNVSTKLATVFKGTGLTSYKDFSPLAMNSNIEHHYNSANEGRYVVLISVGNKRGLYVYDDDWKQIDCLIQDIDQHDFIYIDDFHYIVFKNTHVECEKDGKTVTLLLPCIYEYKNGKVIASRLLNDKIITDDIYMFSFEQGTHLNTMRFDGDDQTKIILNARHNMSFYILERKVSNDGAVTFGNILYQVGGLHSAKNYDIESRIKTPDECQWFLCHDVKRWGNKKINGISYPVYTLFDNNTKWSINPRNGGNGTDKNVNSRIVQMAIDFANKKIVEYKCYYIEGYYSDIMSSAIMFNEGVLFVDYARKPMAGLYDYTTEVTEHVGNTYKNAKKLLEFYSGTQTPYRVNTFNLK